MASSAPRKRLLLTIYLVGVAQLAVAGVAIFVVQRLLQSAPWQMEPARQRALLDSYCELYDTPELLGRALSHLHEVDLTFYRDDGTLVASTQSPLKPLDASHREELARAGVVVLSTDGPVPITVVPIMHDGKHVGYGMVHRHPPPGAKLPATLTAPGAPQRRPAPLIPPPSRLPLVIAIALIGAAIISFWFARSLARPLLQLANTAQAFGAGDLSARARIRRDDELGAVARTFDEMADRVNAMLVGQREFLANVSHELRTPLARIRVALDIAAEGDLEAAKQSLREIAADWSDLDRLVEDVLAVARFDLAHASSVAAVTLEYEALDLQDLIERVLVAFRAVHPMRAVELVGCDQPIALVADGVMVRRVIGNLLDNAAKYSDPGTPIRLEVRAGESEIDIAVGDRGIGIDAVDLPRLFEPFFRTDRSRARKSGGVGLGLALAKRIVEAHGGTIAVESVSGSGTTVRFTIPTA
jgi:two-component system, OmpR family, sensor kinase